MRFICTRCQASTDIPHPRHLPNCPTCGQPMAAAHLITEPWLDTVGRGAKTVFGWYLTLWVIVIVLAILGFCGTGLLIVLLRLAQH